MVVNLQAIRKTPTQEIKKIVTPQAEQSPDIFFYFSVFFFIFLGFNAIYASLKGASELALMSYFSSFVLFIFFLNLKYYKKDFGRFVFLAAIYLLWANFIRVSTSYITCVQAAGQCHFDIFSHTMNIIPVLVFIILPIHIILFFLIHLFKVKENKVLPTAKFLDFLLLFFLALNIFFYYIS